jgi:hypothetical protein
MNIHEKEVDIIAGRVTVKVPERRSNLKDTTGHKNFMKDSKNLVSNFLL